MDVDRTFVGRARELDLLGARLDDARGGRGQLVLVTGEPGIGKTRLAEELARHAETSGVPVGWGRASEDEGSPPYWIFRQLDRSTGRAMPGLLTGGPAGGGPAEARFEAFEAVADDLRAAARAQGLLVVLDDLQWADAASLALLVHLARAIGRSRLMIVATYRDTETTGRGPLSSALSALARESNLSRIRLVGLTQAEVERQLSLVTRTPVPPELAVLVSRRTGGNPFFVTELGRLAGSAGRALPDAVLDTVRARLARLGGPCRQLIATAAVLGSELDPAALAEVARRPVAQVLADLDEAATAGIVADADGWRFGHDLIRESARLNLPTAARLTAHARLAACLESRADATARTSEIAYHWLESLPVGDPARACEWAERAAGLALGQLAWERAAHLYRRARETGARLPAADRTRLLRGQGIAHLRGGDVQAGSAALTAAAEAAREAGDPAALGEVALAIEGLSDPWGSFRGGPIAAEALAGLPPGDTPLRARLLALQAGEAGFAGGADPDRVSAESLAMAERLDDGQVLRSALRARQMVRSGPDGVAERLELGNRMLALGKADEDDDAALWGRLWRFDALAMLGRLDEAEGELAAIRAVAKRLQRPLASWHYLRSKAAIDLARGRFDDAAAATQESLALVEGRAHDSLPGVPITVLTAIAGLTGRRELVTEQMLELFDRSAPRFIIAMLSLYWLRLGDPERARQHYNAIPAGDIPVPALISVAATIIELAAEFGPPAAAERAAAALRPHPDLFVTGGAGSIVVSGSVRTVLGVAAAAAGRPDDAVRELRLGIAADDRAGTPPFAALARFELARVLARRRRPGDVEEASALAASVADTAGQLGMAPLRRRAEELAAALRGDTPGPLTRREREVAAHVAQGLTNKQIAALLHISERTAETHVQHILSKLSLANRTHIATWARDGLRTGRPY
jgi:DNA-binding CsgD family transcriptional regulator